MSAILGIRYFDGRRVDRNDLDRMLLSIAHRGPDRTGLWFKGSVGLGHLMLNTTPESLNEQLPLVNSSDGLVLTADARIDNRDELIASLDPYGRKYKGVTDSELILAVYKKWRERCTERLIGDFVFAIWDKRKQILFCARDHFGVKPFYYYRSDKIFVFSSEIKAILCLPDVPRRLNETRVAEYLAPMFNDRAITFYQDIFRLPQGNTITVNRGKARLQTYWSLDPVREIRLGSDDEYALTFRELFIEAVRCRLRSAFPAGSMLSGGLDSSSITCAARKLFIEEKKNRRLHTFSAIFDDVPECDERAFINTVLQGGNLEPHYVHADSIGPLTDLDRVFFHQDEPFYAPNLFVHQALFSAARQNNIRVLLDGVDGDTTVSHGFAFLIELALTGRWITLAGEIDGLSRNFNQSPWRILKGRVLMPLIPETVKQAWRILRNPSNPAWAVNPVVNPDFAKRIRLKERFNTLEKAQVEPAHTARSDHYRRLTWGLLPFILEVTDRAAAAFSVEPRYPFFDRRLIEFCLAIPPEQKIYKGVTRLVMRRAMADILPADIQRRGGKTNLSPNFRHGLLTFSRELLNEVILDDTGYIEEYVNITFLQNVYRQYMSDGRAKEEDVMEIWKAATLALWLRSTGLNP